MVLIVVTITLERSPILLGFVAKCPSVCNTLRWRLSHSLSLSLKHAHTCSAASLRTPTSAHARTHTISRLMSQTNNTCCCWNSIVCDNVRGRERETNSCREKEWERKREREKDRRKGGNVFLFSSSRWLNLLFFTKNCYHWLFNPQNKWCLWFHKVGQPMP